MVEILSKEIELLNLQAQKQELIQEQKYHEASQLRAEELKLLDIQNKKVAQLRAEFSKLGRLEDQRKLMRFLSQYNDNFFAQHLDCCLQDISKRIDWAQRNRNFRLLNQLLREKDKIVTMMHQLTIEKTER